MIEASRARIRVGVLGIALASIVLAAAGCEQEPPKIDLSTKGGAPGSMPSPQPQKIEIQKKPGK